MAKLRSDPITQTDLDDFLKSEADFAFEMRTLSLLEKLGFRCDHGGTYTDPVTGKLREFDIRARMGRGLCRLALAVECKNLRTNFPLLTHAVPRKETEALHTLVVFKQRVTASYPVPEYVMSFDSVYRPSDLVVKQVDQVGRTLNNEFFTSDQQVFEKVSQSVNSSYDLVRAAFFGNTTNAVHAILPLLVIPDHTLWLAEYTSSGEQKDAPREIDQCEVFLGKEWQIDLGPGRVCFRMSHVHVVTSAALEKTIHRLADGANSSESVFALANSLHSRA